MFRMKLVDHDPTRTASTHASRSIPLTLALPDDTQLTVWITHLNAHVVDGVLIATGTATLPGVDSDTFTARVRADDTTGDRLAITLEFGSPSMDPLDFVVDMEHVLGDNGVVHDTTVFKLLNEVLAGGGP